MDNFIVLGLVPGTNLQITFELWLQTAAAFLGLGLLVYAYKIFTFPLPAEPSRQTMHASQLHHRA
jgi:hypothetical protein